MTSLTTPRLRVTCAGEEPFIVQILNPDLVRWDREAVRQRWPTAERAPMLWTTFVAWSAARRTGAIPEDRRYSDFEASTELIEMVDAAGNAITGDEAETADPTQPGPGPD